MATAIAAAVAPAQIVVALAPVAAAPVPAAAAPAPVVAAPVPAAVAAEPVHEYTDTYPLQDPRCSGLTQCHFPRQSSTALLSSCNDCGENAAVGSGVCVLVLVLVLLRGLV